MWAKQFHQYEQDYTLVYGADKSTNTRCLMLDHSTFRRGILNDFEFVEDLTNDQIDKHRVTAIRKCHCLSMAM